VLRAEDHERSGKNETQENIMINNQNWPFEPILELQSEIGVDLYLSELSEPARQEPLSVISNVIAAKQKQV